ncbi:DUF6932 family protein [Gordonia sp. (in: high G+C Gram-positive bacteria)]|uniref:DUF6932 family protein n=1 Tax=Gordonia sp. (in: high G+C Gram-positive bacteria) TaxID=84139 RepID=UPI003C786BDF
MIPDLHDGHLPVGRFGCTLEEVHSRFVAAETFTDSETRSDLWDGLVKYLAEWETINARSEVLVLERIWIGGSFASSELNPSDVDVSPILGAAALAAARSARCSKRIKKLIEHRDGVRRHYGVEPFVIEREPLTSILTKRLSAAEYEYIATRGLFDDFWMRRHARGPKQGLSEDTAQPRRGYLEVNPWH